MQQFIVVLTVALLATVHAQVERPNVVISPIVDSTLANTVQNPNVLSNALNQDTTVQQLQAKAAQNSNTQLSELGAVNPYGSQNLNSLLGHPVVNSMLNNPMYSPMQIMNNPMLRMMGPRGIYDPDYLYDMCKGDMCLEPQTGFRYYSCDLIYYGFFDGSQCAPNSIKVGRVPLNLEAIN